MGPLPSIGLAERVDDAADERLADGHVDDAAGALDDVALLDARVASPKMATPTLSSSRLSTMPMTPPGNSTSSPAMAPVEAVDAGDAVADA